MGNLTLKVPFLPNIKPFADSAISQYKAQTQSIFDKYGKIIETVAALTNVKREIEGSFIAVESGGNANSVNGDYIGLCQISIQAAGDAITMEQMKKRLTDPEKKYLIKYLGDAKVNAYLKRANLGEPVAKGFEITKTELLKPELNIMCASLVLGQLMAKYGNSDAWIAKVIWGYNNGYFSKVYGDTIEDIYNNANAITKSYIGKIGGKNGYLTFFNNIQ